MRIPQYTSSQQLSTQAPNVKVDASVFGQTGKNMAALGDQVTQLGFKIKESRDNENFLTAQATLNGRINEVKKKMASDTDIYGNQQVYQKELNDAYTESAKLINNPEHLSKFQASAGIDMQNINYDISVKGSKQQLDRELYAGLTKHEELTSAFPSANDSEKIFTLKQIRADHDSWVKRGLMTPEQGAAGVKARLEDIRTNSLAAAQNAAVMAGPEGVKQFVENIGEISKNIGAPIDDKTKNQWIQSSYTMLGNMEKRIKSEAIEVQTQGRVQTLLGITSGKTKIEDLNIADIAEKDPELAQAVMNVKDFQIGYVPAGPQSIAKQVSYSDSIKGIFDKNDNKALSDFLVEQLGSKTPGVTTGMKLAIFTDLARLKAAANNPKNADDLKAKDRLNSVFQAMSMAGTSSLSESIIEKFLIKSHLTQATGDQNKVIVKEAAKSAVSEKYPSASKYTAPPNYVQEGEDGVEMVYDGPNELEGESYGSDGTETESDYIQDTSA